MKLILTVFLACLLGCLAHAQENSEDFCKRMVQHVPIDNTKYQKDSEVPTDLNAVEDPVLDSISIPVEIDLVEFFDRPDLRAVPGLNLEPDIANVEVNQDGSVFYNGQEISQDIQRLCGTPVPEDRNVIQPKAASTEPKPAAVVSTPKPKLKPKLQPKDKKSSVKVFNGPKPIIADVPEIKPEKQKSEDQNAIDVEALDAQKNTDDDDTIIEGQYP